MDGKKKKSEVLKVWKGRRLDLEKKKKKEIRSHGNFSNKNI